MEIHLFCMIGCRAISVAIVVMSLFNYTPALQIWHASDQTLPLMGKGWPYQTTDTGTLIDVL